MTARIVNLFRKKLEYYTTIEDLPIKNWFKIQKTNDISFLLKVKHEINEHQKDELEKAFELIWREYIDTFGISDTLREILELRRDIQVLKIDMYLQNDRSKLTFINIKEKELKAILEKQESQQLDNTKGYVEKFLRFKLDENTTTVKEYYGYVKMLEMEILNQKQSENVRGED